MSAEPGSAKVIEVEHVLGEWHVPKAALGPVFSASLFGMLLGALALSALADRIGRRPVLIGATLFFALAMLATLLVATIRALLTLRFITGLGLGCIMPNAMARVGRQLIALNWSNAALFHAAALPVCCSALLVIALAGATRQRDNPTAQTA